MAKQASSDIDGPAPRVRNACCRTSTVLLLVGSLLIVAMPSQAKLRPSSRERPVVTVPASDAILYSTIGVDGKVFAFCPAARTDDGSSFQQTEVQLVDPMGQALAAPAAVSPPDTVDCDMASAPDGSWMIVYGQAYPSRNVFVRTLSADGTTLGVPVQLNTVSADELNVSDVIYAGAGVFVATWFDYDGYDAPEQVYARRFNSSGNPLGPVFRFVDAPVYGERRAELSSSGNGRFGVIWNVAETQASGYSQLARSYLADGTALGGPVLLHHGQRHHTESSSGMAADGSVVFAHRGELAFDDDVSILSPDGTSAVENVDVDPPLAVAGNGNWVASSPDLGPRGTDDESFSMFAIDGSPLGISLTIRDDLRPAYHFSFRNVHLNSAGSLSYIIHTFDIDGAQLAVRRICDSSDAECDGCPGYDHDLDTDGDLVPDGCDVCTNLGASREAISGRLVMSNNDATDTYARRTNRVRIELTAQLPDGVDFAELAVAARGMTIRAQSPDGSSPLQVTLPGGVYKGRGTGGWTGSSGRWSFVDRTGAPQRGFRKLRLRRIGGDDSRKVQLSAWADSDKYGLSHRYLPLQLSVTFGDPSDAAIGACAEIHFTDQECVAALDPVFPDNNGTIRCQRQ
ncbi:MAG TPA: hypothetical protein VEL28_02460 [Candidatus Binatia bacterium]|nr:hypothetical protein [Candidatus Binatia bacterium]